ncbi:hypothetical protein VOLCADRAFT_94294 [Volvox carteri f. nagariensis]|uniref:XPA C-terminal domain-containing protein n=1 Tax=Volvox carteri f. nagariensis TaxID=3068 RepID=D8U443_VOLCA|nr:uncharacterized protein VOLCADRAFT_94294 [Volvox carteri f. nagariensis]EFJ45434.1 hypothetical protein VOLCADRAFT_94294 [Volvox carteri f. nagariensis]|eukprot:XP_002953461.1 hypothetical protein VOLCADRAFT_94294 [Volvox carteri f. nagariensis]
MADGGGFFQASGCETCGNLSFSSEWYQAFGVVLCNHCKRNESLISKDNPQKKTWSAMKLYLRRQAKGGRNGQFPNAVEERACRKHGDLDTVRQLRHDRTQAKAEGWLAKRARGGGPAEDDGDEEEVEGEDEGAEVAGTEREGGGRGGATRVKLSAVAARVRARLASEYESGAAGRQANTGNSNAGGSVSGAGSGGGAGGGDAADGGDVEVLESADDIVMAATEVVGFNSKRRHQQRRTTSRSCSSSSGGSAAVAVAVRAPVVGSPSPKSCSNPTPDR